MLLLSIAHKGEAQEFIRRKFTQPVQFHFNGLFRGEEGFLLLSSEGIERTTIHLTAVLTYFGRQIDRVLNIGIAGALSQKLEINQIYGIRRVYHELNGQSDYPFFSGKETHSKYDCVSTLRRVTDSKYADHLKKIAPVCDRELWAIGFVCHQFNLPFKAYKLISDMAGNDTDQKQIVDQSVLFSKHLFDFYKKLSLKNEDWIIA